MHPDSAIMLHLCEYIWFCSYTDQLTTWHKTADKLQNKTSYREKSLIPICREKQGGSTSFRRTQSNEINDGAFLLVAIDKLDKWSKFPTAKRYQHHSRHCYKVYAKHISKNRVPRKLMCDQAQTFSVIKLIFTNQTISNYYLHQYTIIIRQKWSNV